MGNYFLLVHKLKASVTLRWMKPGDFSFPSLNHPPTRATHTPEDLSVLWPFEVALVFGRMATAADYSLGICGWHDEGWVGQPRGSLCWAS